MNLEEWQARMVLSGLTDFGPVSIRRLVSHFGSAEAVLEASLEALIPLCSRSKALAVQHWAERFDLPRELALLERHRAQYVIEGDALYPALLSQIHDAPVGLYWQGPVQCSARCVAIVGTRRAGAYGRKIAREFAAELARLDITVVSGLAAGIDAEAHVAALDAGGRTVAILGNGLDLVYPRENAQLFSRMREEAAVVSEFYFGRVADRQSFPQRNRIVSGMSDAIVVVESGEKGGSMITAKFAAEQGRTVCAVPGRIDQAASLGCHSLIRDGATLVASIDHLLEELHGTQVQLELGAALEGEVVDPEGDAALPRGLEPEEAAVARHFLDGDCLHADHIVDRSGMATFTVNAALLMLELKGVLAKRPDGSYERAF